MEDGIAQSGFILSAAVYLSGLIAAGLALHLMLVAVLAIASAGLTCITYQAWLWQFHGVAGGLSVISNALAVTAGIVLVVGIA